MNGRKRRACCSGVMPMPVSLTANSSSTSRSSTRSGRTETTTSPRSVNLTALEQRFDEDLLQSQGIPDEVDGRFRRDAEQHLQSLLVGPHAHHAAEVVEDLLKIEPDVLHRKLAGLDFGEVQDVIDDAEQGVARIGRFC